MHLGVLACFHGVDARACPQEGTGSREYFGAHHLTPQYMFGSFLSTCQKQTNKLDHSSNLVALKTGTDLCGRIQLFSGIRGPPPPEPTP